MKMVEQRDDAEVRGSVPLTGQMELGYPWLPLTQLSDCIWMSVNLNDIVRIQFVWFSIHSGPHRG